MSKLLTIYHRLRLVPVFADLADSRLGFLARRLLSQAVLLREPVRFVAAGALGLRGIHPYHLRDDGAAVWLRHPVDSWTFGDVIRDEAYEPPPSVRAVLGARPSIADLGANVGLFGVYAFRSFPGCHVIGYEPDMANAAVLRRTLAKRLANGDYQLVEAAAGTDDGVMRFAMGLGDRSRADSAGTPVPVRDVLPVLASADLVKIDIEGGEWPILADARLAEAGPRALVVEYHSEGAPAADARAAAESLLRAADYDVVSFRPTPPAEPEGQGVIWAVRRSQTA